MQENRLIIFVKNPEAGRVKKRLAATLGGQEAARIYRSVAKGLVASLRPPAAAGGYTLQIAFWPPEARAAVERWLGGTLSLADQQGADLGRRMLGAFTSAFDEGCGRAVIIGSDCPAVTAALIEEAFESLRNHDAVIGPAADGGYYLIGLRRAVPELFAGIAWGTQRVLGQTIRRCSALGLACSLLPELRDIDRPEDLAYYRERGLAV